MIDIKRYWYLRRLRRQWLDDRILRKAAIQKGWFGVLEVFHFERSYQDIKRGVRRNAFN